MKYLNISKSFAVFAMGTLVFVSCDKVTVPESMGDAGKTIVKFTTNYQLLNVDYVSTPQNITLFDLRRDVSNNVQLNTPMNIIVKEDPSVVTAYDPSLLPMPTGLLTYNPLIPHVGTNFTFSMNNGDFAKQLTAVVNNATLLDLNNRYAVGFSIISADASGFITNTVRSIVIEIGAKNAWDGKYQDTWTNYHPASNPGYTGSSTPVEMRTSSGNKVKIWFTAAGAYGNPAILGGNLSYFGLQEPEYTINIATNVVTVQNTAAGAVTFYNMAAGFNSRWDVPSKTFYTKFGYNNPGGIFDPTVTREWTQTLKYLGPR